MKKAAISLAALVVAASTVVAQDWNQWRGDKRTGATTTFKAPAAWPEKPTRVWQVNAGTGHASPVVSVNKVYLLSRVGEQEAITAYDLATGKQLWRQAYDAPYQMNPAATGHGKGPKSTPVVAGNRVFALGISGVLSALDAATGKVLWRKDFKGEFPSTSPEFGTSMSPIVDGANLIAHVGGSGNGAFAAFDAASGAQKWAWKGDGPAYASPVIATLGGVRQLVTQSQKHVIGISAADGKLLWQIPFTTEYEQNIITPVIVRDLVIYSGINKPLTAMRVTHAGGKWTTEQVWQNADLPLYMSSPVEVNGTFYGLTHRNRGQFFAADAQTGKTLWTTRGREAENAAFVAAGDLLIATTTEGELVISRIDPKAFTQVKRYTVAQSPIWAHPAPTSRGIVIKDAETLALWSFQ